MSSAKTHQRTKTVVGLSETFEESLEMSQQEKKRNVLNCNRLQDENNIQGFEF